MRRLTGDFAPVESHLARARFEPASDQVEERRFAGSVRSDDGVAVTLSDFQAHVVDGAQAAEALAEVFESEQHLARVHRLGLDGLALQRLAHVDHADCFAGAFSGGGFRLLAAMKTLTQAKENRRRIGDVARHSEDDAQHDGAEDDVELVRKLLRDRVVERDVDKGTDRGTKKGRRAAKQRHDNWLRVGRPVEHLWISLLLIHDEKPAGYSREKRGDRVHGELVGPDVDADGCRAVAILANRKEGGAEW